MQTLQTLIEVRQSEPTNNLVESRPVQEGRKLSEKKLGESFSWQDLQGLSWIFQNGNDD